MFGGQNPLTQGMLALLAAHNPGAVAQMAAAKGIEPPDPAAGPRMGQPAGPAGTDPAAAAAGGQPDLASLLQPQKQSPFAGVEAPPPAQPPQLFNPGGPPTGQAPKPAVTLPELLMLMNKNAGQPPGMMNSGIPTLGALLGR